MLKLKGIFLQLDKPGTPGAKARSTTPNASTTPKSSLGSTPGTYPPSPYQRPSDPYGKPPGDPYGRSPMPFDPHTHVRALGIPPPNAVTGGKP